MLYLSRKVGLLDILPVVGAVGVVVNLNELGMLNESWLKRTDFISDLLVVFVVFIHFSLWRCNRPFLLLTFVIRVLSHQFKLLGGANTYILRLDVASVTRVDILLLLAVIPQLVRSNLPIFILDPASVIWFCLLPLLIMRNIPWCCDMEPWIRISEICGLLHPLTLLGSRAIGNIQLLNGVLTSLMF